MPYSNNKLAYNASWIVNKLALHATVVELAYYANFVQYFAYYSSSVLIVLAYYANFVQYFAY